jgi:large subunit ribosomal protein L24
MKTIQPRKQRKRLYNAPLHQKRKWLASHLTENLLLKYDKRSVSVIKGDTVKIMRGSYRGHEDKVAQINVGKGYVEIEGLTMVKADGKKIARPIHPSNLLITKLNLTDKWRRRKLERGLSEEVKQEIEKEAEQQLKELEEEQIEQLPEEPGEKLEEQISEEKPPEKLIEAPKQPPKKPKKTPAETQKKPQTKKKQTDIKKKTPAPKKKTVKKTSAKKKPEDKL